MKEKYESEMKSWVFLIERIEAEMDVKIYLNNKENQFNVFRSTFNTINEFSKHYDLFKLYDLVKTGYGALKVLRHKIMVSLKSISNKYRILDEEILLILFNITCSENEMFFNSKYDYTLEDLKLTLGWKRKIPPISIANLMKYGININDASLTILYTFSEEHTGEDADQIFCLKEI